MEEDRKYNQKLFYRVLKILRRVTEKDCDASTIKDKNGNILKEEEIF